MDFAYIIIILSLSVYGTWRSPLYPFVFLIFVNSLEYWVRLRVPFFYDNRSVLDLFFLSLVALSMIRHGVPYIKQNGVFFQRSEFAVIILIAYSWLSYNWGLGNEFFSRQSGLFLKTLVNEITFILFIPLLFKCALGKHDFKRDFLLVGLFIIPVIALTTNWDRRGANFLFMAIDANIGEYAKASFNPLQLAYFGSVMILFNTFYLSKDWISKISFLIVVPLSFYIIFETQSRGQLFAVLICLMLFFPFTYQRFYTKHFAALVTAIIILLIIIIPNISTIIPSALDMLGFDESYARRFSLERMTTAFDNRGQKISDTAMAWQSSLFSILMGLGTATSTSKQVAGAYIHNVSLEILFEQGLIGMSIYLYIISKTFLAIYNMFNIQNLSVEDRQLATFISSLFFLSFIISFKQGALYNNFTFLMMPILCVILAAHLLEKYREKQQLPYETKACCV